MARTTNEFEARALAELATHLPGTTVQGDHLAWPELGLTIRCECEEPESRAAIILLRLFLSGPRLGEAAVETTFSRVAATSMESVVAAACGWAGLYGPVLRAALTGVVSDTVTALELERDGRAYHGFYDAEAWAASLNGEDPTSRVADACHRFATDGSFCATAFAATPWPLDARHATVVSLFVADSSGRRIVEVRANGHAQPGMAAAFMHVEGEAPGAMIFMREVVVLVPREPLPLPSPTSIPQALANLATSPPPWMSWQAHSGRLRDALSDAQVRELEAVVGALPASYRRFVMAYGSSGAGPGYGLLSPLAPELHRFAKGPFAWHDGANPGGDDPKGVLPLAHAGCGQFWLLVLQGPHAGEVWIDARCSDGRVRRVAPSVEAWYLSWLASVQRGVPWVQWSATGCAPSQVIEQLLAQGSTGHDLGLTHSISSGSAYFAERAQLGICDGCAAFVARIGARCQDVATLTPPFTPIPKKPGLWQRLFGRRGD